MTSITWSTSSTRTLPGGACLPARAQPAAFLRDAAVDDEPDTGAERAAVAEAHEDLAAGRVISHEHIRREFGIE